MYKYCHQKNSFIEDENESISLHDCKATKIELHDGKISFHFQDGFWVEKNENGVRKMFYTGKSQIEFPLVYSDDADVTCYIFTKENGKTVRDEYAVNDFIKLINEKTHRLEFLYEYIGYMAFRFDCWLWFDKEPYHKECEIMISAEKAVCVWDEMYEAEN